jgi:putative transposase
MFHHLVRLCQSVIVRGLKWLDQQVQKHTRPSTLTTAVGAVADLSRSKTELMVENALLRQQLVVLRRSVKRPHLTNKDRRVLVLLASRLRRWQDALLVVKPDTLITWHRQLFKLVWRRKSRTGVGRPALAPEVVQIIQVMAADNPLWGAERIRGELLKLGFTVNKGTIRKYMRHPKRTFPSGQTWTTFVRNHAPDVWACDFLPVVDIFFRLYHAFFIIELGSRRIVHVGVTDAPTDAWTAQQLREATPFGQGPEYLIRDNDGKYGKHFANVAAGAGIQVLNTPVKAPRANAFCERFFGSVRRECLDHMLILGQYHLHRVLRQYALYFNHDRPHQGIQQNIPLPIQSPRGSELVAPNVVRRSVLGGLHHVYHRAA